MTQVFSAVRRLISVSGLITAAALSGCGNNEVPKPPPKPVAWTTVQAWSSSETRQLPGLVRASQRAPLSFEVPGRVVSVKVEIGEQFKAGDTLAELDDRQFRLTMEERRANLAEARALLTEADKTLERKTALMARKVGSQAAVDNARAARDSSQARVDRLSALLSLAREDLEDTQLQAPYDGAVLQRMVEPSQQVQAGQTVFEVRGAAEQPEVIVSVPETVVGRLEIGASVPVQFPARPELKLRARVSEIGAGAVERNAFPVTLALVDAPADLRPGMTAEVLFSLALEQASRADVMAIPVTAFMAGPEQAQVAMVFDPATSEVNRRAIRVAEIRGDQALVSEGLASGEIIVTRGLPYLHDGQTVRRLGVGTSRFQE